MYSPVFGENLEVHACADGKIPVIEMDYGGPGKRYFVGPANVPCNAPVDQFVLLTVAEKPAIACVPAPSGDGGVDLVVIERFPGEKKPGIMVFVRSTNLERAVAIAVQIMGGR